MIPLYTEEKRRWRAPGLCSAGGNHGNGMFAIDGPLLVIPRAAAGVGSTRRDGWCLQQAPNGERLISDPVNGPIRTKGCI